MSELNKVKIWDDYYAEFADTEHGEPPVLVAFVEVFDDGTEERMDPKHANSYTLNMAYTALEKELRYNNDN